MVFERYEMKASGGMRAKIVFGDRVTRNRATKPNPVNDRDRFNAALSQIAGKRLTFEEVTGKGAPRAKS